MSDNQLQTRSAAVSESQEAEPKFIEGAGSNSNHNQQQADNLLIAPNNLSGDAISPRKLAANRRNAQKSTGPKTAVGKAISSWNSLKHGLLSRRLYEHTDQTAEKFAHLLSSLQQDLEPVGTLEQLLVEKIAHEYWRLGVAMWYENDEIHSQGRRHFGSSETMHRLIRYQTMVNRQLFQAINQLERLQRLRRGEIVPAPASVQASGDVASSSEP